MPQFRTLFTLALALLTAAQSQAEDSGTLGVVIVEGVTPPGNGLLNPQDGGYAGSVVSRTAIEQKNSLNNAYQAIDLLPGINTYSYDATGLFGGGLRMRGFNSDQIGVTVDGAPINDAGNFAVFPSELIDSENLEQIEVNQGTNKIDAPLVGATGGTIGLTTSAPKDEARFRVQQSYGAFDAYKTFVRADTGYLGDKRFKAFLSVSKAEADKWKGYGGADREHLDFQGVLNLSPGNSITGGLMYNQLLNNNLRTLTLAQIRTLGRNADFGYQAPRHLPAVNGSVQNESAPADGYYDLSLNPFRNYLATLKGRFTLQPNLKLEVDPYYNYGYGHGGTQLTRLAESNAPANIGGGIQDINLDGDTLDTIMVYSGTVTETERPGITARIRSQITNHRLMAGYWFEYAHHRRTQPAVRFDSAGNSADRWLDDSSLYLLREDGTPYQNRDVLTESYSQSFFAEDSIGFLDDKLKIDLGLRYTEIRRDFYNYASNGAGSGADYNIKASYARPLPKASIRYRFDDHHQIFAGGSEHFKAPPDSVLYNLVSGGSYTNGKLSNYKILSSKINEETSTNWEAGYRYSSENLSFAGTLFYIDYRNRIATAYDQATDSNTSYNVGDANTKGIELESAWRFMPNWSIYGSITITDSRMNQNLTTQLTDTNKVSRVVTLETSGKSFPDVPNWLAGASLQYRDGPFSANLSAKYTGERFATLVNDQSIQGYTLVSFDAGYRLPSTGWFKDPTLKLNVYNLLDEDYLSVSASSGSGFTTHSTGFAAAAPSYYIGAPRSFSVMISTDF